MANQEAGESGDNAEGPYDPLDLLYGDMWLEVLKHLDTDSRPRDLINMHDTCQYFGDLLDSHRVAGRASGKSTCRLEEVLPLVFSWLGPLDAIHLRLVCKRVGHTVDKILDYADRLSPNQHLDLFPGLLPPYPTDSSMRASYEWRTFRPRFSLCSKHLMSIPEMAEYRKYLENEMWKWKNDLRKRKSAMVSKKISIDGPLSPDDPILLNGLLNPMAHAGVAAQPEVVDQETFLSRTMEFLAAIQHEKIRWVNITISQDMLLTETYNLVGKLIGSVPHIRRLDFYHRRNIHWGTQLENEVERLDNFIQAQHLLPIAPNLERITLRNVPLPRPFLQQLAKAYGGQLRTLILRVCDNQLFEERPEDLPSFHFPALLRLELVLHAEYQPLVVSFKAPQLMSLSLQVDRPTLGSRPAVPLVELTEAISNFPSISFLYLRLFRHISKPTRAQLLMGLGTLHRPPANLKNLVIHGASHENVNLRFLATFFANVESISVKETYQEMLATTDPYLIRLRRGTMQRSKIWERAPKLQTLSLTIYQHFPEMREIHVCQRPPTVSV